MMSPLHLNVAADKLEIEAGGKKNEDVVYAPLKLSY